MRKRSCGLIRPVLKWWVRRGKKQGGWGDPLIVPSAYHRSLWENVMIWGCFSWSGLDSPMRPADYLNALNHHVFPSLIAPVYSKMITSWFIGMNRITLLNDDTYIKNMKSFLDSPDDDEPTKHWWQSWHPKQHCSTQPWCQLLSEYGEGWDSLEQDDEQVEGVRRN